MDKGRSREGSRKKMEGWSRSVRVEPLKSFQGIPSVYTQYIHSFLLKIVPKHPRDENENINKYINIERAGMVGT